MTRARELAELASAYDSGSSLGFRNRIINGDMRIDQRNAGASVNVPNATFVYAVDRFGVYHDTSVTASAQQSSIVPSGGGFTKSLLYTITTGANATATQQNLVQQSIEGLNVSDLGWGAAGAASVTVSFWVRSSVAGTYGFSLSNSAANRVYMTTFTISAANTWEYKTLTVPGDTTGTWSADNGLGIRVRWDIGSGGNFQGTPNVWGSSLINTTSAQANVIGTSGATFYITGVQLEAGTVASPFERRDYGRELMMCQRYFEKSYDIGTVPGTVTANAMSLVWCGQSGSGTLYTTSVQMMVEKRSNPTLTAYDYASGTVGQWRFGTMGSSETAGAFTFTEINTKRIRGTMSPGTSGNNVCYGHWTASAEL